MGAMAFRPRLTRPRLAAATVATAIAVLAGCAGTNAVSQSVSGSNGYQSGAALRWVAAGDRPAVSGVRGELLDGARFDLSSWRGKVVVVNFWESDCAPCRTEAQALNQVYVDERAHGVEFLGVDIRDGRANAQEFARSHHVGYPSLFDPSGLVGLHFHGLAPNATPTTIVLDRAGRIAARNSGAILYTQLRDVVARVVGESA
jgi:thiol-disulfide isomerase/thioredoxin